MNFIPFCCPSSYPLHHSYSPPYYLTVTAVTAVTAVTTVTTVTAVTAATTVTTVTAVTTVTSGEKASSRGDYALRSAWIQLKDFADDTFAFERDFR